MPGCTSDETSCGRVLEGEASHIPGDGCGIESLVIKISVLSRALFLSNNLILLKNIKLKVIIIDPKENRIKCHTKLYHSLV